MVAKVIKSINGLVDAKDESGKIWKLRIKGKVLSLESEEYNPLSSGDDVVFTPLSDGEGLITERLERHSSFSRWNQKRECNQTIASNIDQVAIVLSPESPPYRSRFLDRALCSIHGAKPLIVLNKCDLGVAVDVKESLSSYSDLGYDVVYLSAKFDPSPISGYLSGKITCFVGQSGVGKSSLVNALLDAHQRVGSIVWKYDRGRHTTNHSVLIEGDGFSIIDTPGVREIIVPMEEKRSVLEAFPELRGIECRYKTCLHEGEDGCMVSDLIRDGRIKEERYESYLRILSSLDERRPEYERRAKRG